MFFIIFCPNFLFSFVYFFSYFLSLILPFSYFFVFKFYLMVLEHGFSVPPYSFFNFQVLYFMYPFFFPGACFHFFYVFQVPLFSSYFLFLKPLFSYLFFCSILFPYEMVLLGIAVCRKIENAAIRFFVFFG